MKTIFALLLISMNAIAATTPVKNVMTFDEKEGKLEFRATTHPVGVNVNGEGPVPKGVLTLDNGKLTGDLTVDLTKLDSKMSMRTTHMKEKALEVDKYPEAKLAITDLKIISGADSVPFRGNLTLHGVTKPVEGKAKIERLDESMTIHADFDLKLSDYAIVVKPFAGMSVDDKVSVSVDTKAALSSVATTKQ